MECDLTSSIKLELMLLRALAAALLEEGIFTAWLRLKWREVDRMRWRRCRWMESDLSGRLLPRFWSD